MKAFQAPISDMAVSLYLKRNSPDVDADLSFEFTKVVEMILLLSKKEGIESACDKMKADILELRLKTASQFAPSHAFWSIFFENSARQITRNVNSKTELGRVVSELLLIIDEQVAVIAKDFGSELQALVPALNYKSFKALLSLLPQDISGKLLSWIDYALELDIALTIAELMFAEKLILPKKEQQKLINLIQTKGEEFTMLLIELEILDVDDRDISQMHRNAKIRLALRKAESGDYAGTVSFDELKSKLSA